MDSILRRGNPLEKTGEKTREKTRVKPREKAPTRVAIGKFWARANSVNNAARARTCAAGNARFGGCLSFCVLIYTKKYILSNKRS